MTQQCAFKHVPEEKLQSAFDFKGSGADKATRLREAARKLKISQIRLWFLLSCRYFSRTKKAGYTGQLAIGELIESCPLRRRDQVELCVCSAYWAFLMEFEPSETHHFCIGGSNLHDVYRAAVGVTARKYRRAYGGF